MIDEINLADKKPAQRKKFDRLFNYCSTHCSLVDYHAVPGRVYRTSLHSPGGQSLGAVALVRRIRSQYIGETTRNQGIG